MAGRIRSIKPELREWLPYAGLTDGAARLFAMMLTLADDAGRLPAAPGFLAGAVFYVRQRSANVIGQLLAEIEAAELVRRYTAQGGSFAEVVGWSDKGHVNYQYISKPQPSRYPAPPWARDRNGNTADDRPENRTDPDPDPDPRSPTSDQEGGRDRKGDGTPPLAVGWMPRQGGKAWKLEQQLVAQGEDVDAEREAWRAWYTERGIEVRDPEGALASWYEKGLAKKAKQTAPKKAAARAKRSRSATPKKATPDSPEIPSGFTPPAGPWVQQVEGHATWHYFVGPEHRATFASYLDAPGLTEQLACATSRKVGDRDVRELEKELR